jgi:hypothetical protein
VGVAGSLWPISSSQQAKFTYMIQAIDISDWYQHKLSFRIYGKIIAHLQIPMKILDFCLHIIEKIMDWFEYLFEIILICKIGMNHTQKEKKTFTHRTLGRSIFFWWTNIDSQTWFVRSHCFICGLHIG